MSAAATVVTYGLIAVISASAACLLGLHWRALWVSLTGAPVRTWADAAPSGRSRLRRRLSPPSALT